MHVAVVMPARNEEQLIRASIKSVPDSVECLIVVDDGSIDSTSSIANDSLEKWSSGRSVISECISTNGEGVGAAIMFGIDHLSVIVDNPEEWAVVIMAGDGQMDPDDLQNLVAELNHVDHVKGNRFLHESGLDNMPLIRKLFSRVIGFLTSLATGWSWGDPQCGYTASRLSLLEKHPRLKKWKGYGYPNWWALSFSESSELVSEVPVRSVYGEESSGIRILKFLPMVSMMLLIGTWRRGWSWYIRGRGRRTSPFHIRFFIVISWFIGWLSLLSFSIDYRLVFLSIPLFCIVRLLDRREQSERTLLATRFEM
jgi:glycosyltransferase involved in cell wall biosynthesis